MNSKRLFQLFLLSVSLIVVSLFITPTVISGTAVAADEEPILVGASVSLTGKYSRTGQEQLHGYAMWVEDVNKRGGLLGRPVKLIHYDDESKPDTGAKLYEKLITSDKVDLLLGPYSSGVTLAVSAVVEKKKFPMVSAGAASTDVWSRDFKYTFGLYTPGIYYMSRILEFAKEKGLKTVAVVNADTTFPRDVIRGVKAKVKELGMDVVLEEEYSKGATDMTPLITKIKVKKPDVLIGGTYLPDSVALVRQSKELNLNVKIFAFSVGPGLPDFGKNLNDDADYVFGSSQWEPNLKLPGVDDFVKRYEAIHGYGPGYHAAGGYGAGQVLEEAVNKAGSLDKEKLRNALVSLETTTVFGSYKVNETGIQIGKPAYMIQWLNGERELVLPSDVSTAEIKYPTPPWDNR
jgi:branched-chain amino acid transport system substrate-binding protein